MQTNIVDECKGMSYHRFLFNFKYNKLKGSVQETNCLKESKYLFYSLFWDIDF